MKVNIHLTTLVIKFNLSKTLFSSFYQELLSSNVLVPFTGIIEGERKQDGVKHFVAPAGISSVVKHFLHSSGV